MSIIWLLPAVTAYGAMFYLVWLAFKPKPSPNPDWFWQGGE